MKNDTPATAGTQTPTPAPQPVATPPTEGGSYVIDDVTGERTLVERTQPNTERRKQP